LRCSDLPDCTGDKAFVERLRARLTTQSPALPQVPGEAIAVPDLPSEPSVRSLSGKRLARPSANDAGVPWKWMAMAASFAAVAAVGWQVSKPAADAGAMLAGAEPSTRAAVAAQSVTAAPQPQLMLRDPRLDELLAAHRQSGGASALPTSAGFLRNATFEPPAR
jgi:sigma-E factor negative regulatory protein RseA